MEHIRQYDWCTSTPDSIYFVTAEGLDNSVTEKILRNKFTNPLLSSDSEDERKDSGQKWDWDQIFHRKNLDNYHRLYVPGLYPVVHSPRQSSLTAQQHMQCLKVLCAQNPHVLPGCFVPRPTKFDLKVFEEVKAAYLKEQAEFIEWAKTLWVSKHCFRALRPKPLVESVYEAEFKVRASRMSSYPKFYEVVAQIPLEPVDNCELVLQKDLIDVNISNLPRLRLPERIEKQLTVLRPCSLPEPCEMHPVRFVLPGEKNISILPLTEIHRELSMFASERGAQFIAAEGALRALAQRRAWALPVAVHAPTHGDGLGNNIIVLGSEFSVKRENVMMRTFKAYRHLLDFSLVPASERAKMLKADSSKPEADRTSTDVPKDVSKDDSWAEPSSDDEDNLFIDFDEMAQSSQSPSQNENETNNEETRESDVEMSIAEDTETSTTEKQTDKTEVNNTIAEVLGVYTCTCKDTIFERPPPRSFRKFQLRNKKNSENYDIIVHSAHKYKGPSGEVLLEPIIEYQADLGASMQSEDRVRSVALSLALRKEATVVNVRLDPHTGDVITIEEIQKAQFEAQHPGVTASVIGSLHTALNQLQGLVPGNYVMAHEPSHGENTLLYAPRSTGAERQLALSFECAQLADADEAAGVKAAPRLTPGLMPAHKFRKLLPCAFTPHPNQVARETKKQATRQKTPPQALKWPKKRGRKRKNTG